MRPGRFVVSAFQYNISKAGGALPFCSLFTRRCHTRSLARLIQRDRGVRTCRRVPRADASSTGLEGMGLSWFQWKVISAIAPSRSQLVYSAGVRSGGIQRQTTHRPLNAGENTRVSESRWRLSEPSLNL